MSRFGTVAICLTLWLVLIIGPCFAGQAGPSEETRLSTTAQSAVQRAPMAVFPTKKHNFGEVSEGTEIKYDFVVENRGNAPLVIKNIRPD